MVGCEGLRAWALDDIDEAFFAPRQIQFNWVVLPYTFLDPQFESNGIPWWWVGSSASP